MIRQPEGFSGSGPHCMRRCLNKSFVILLQAKGYMPEEEDWNTEIQPILFFSAIGQQGMAISKIIWVSEISIHSSRFRSMVLLVIKYPCGQTGRQRTTALEYRVVYCKSFQKQISMTLHSDMVPARLS